MKLENKIKRLKKIKSKLYKKDFLLTWEKRREDLMLLMEIAETLKALRDSNISPKVFDSGLAVSQFRDNSTRTRFSFASAANLLGLEVQDLDESKSQIAHGETVRETANMISFLSDFIGIRDDMYLGDGNDYMREVGAALDEGFREGVLPRRPGIINLQCDIDHPTQSMSDLLHLKKTFGSLEDLKGKKIAVSWAYSPSYGKPLSVPQGLIGLLTRFGMEVSLAYPEGYNLIPEVEEMAAKQAQENGGKFEIVHSMEEAFREADIIYPKSWAPYHIVKERTQLLRNNDYEGLQALEKTALAENAKHKHWEADAQKHALTKAGKALYMHCLPADITDVSCKAGEVSARLFEQYRIPTYHEAGFKPYVIAAMMFANRFERPGEMLKAILERGRKRVGI